MSTGNLGVVVVLQDYWHHWEDVCAGFLLGISIAYAFYRQQFPPLADSKAGHPLQTQLEGEVKLCSHYCVQSANA